MIRGILAIAIAFAFIKYRVQIVENITGKFDFAERYLGSGGTYKLMTILGILSFFWGLASMTGTTDVFFAPFTMLLGVG